MLTRSKVRGRRWLFAGSAAVAIAGCGVTAAMAAVVVAPNPFGTSRVGTQQGGSVLLPDNQRVAPFGQRIEFTADAVGTAISPDGKKIAVQTGGAVTGKSSVDMVDAATGAILQRFGGSYDTPPVYSPDGTALYAGTSTASGGSASGTNTILKYTVGSDGLITNPTSPQRLTLPSNKELPFGLAVSSDGSTLYAALSASNELGVIDTATMELTTKIPVGNAPAAVAIVGNQAFVSNRGGRPAVAGDPTNDSAGTQIVWNPQTAASATGTVSVVDLATATVTDTVKVGLQPASLTVHDGSVFVTNTNSDTVSIIDAASHRVTQTFNVEPLPGSTVGSSPNSVTFAGPHTLLVSVGGDNAVAEFAYSGPTTPVKYQGLIPTDWYPNQVSYDANVGKVFVSNEYGIGTNGADQTHAMIGTLTSFAPPPNTSLGPLTSEVFANNGWNHLQPSNGASQGENSQADTNAQGRGLPAIPTHLGQPSAIKHVFLIIKENRTYDQVLGDTGKGNSDAADTNYGAQVTPNLHSLANTFTLFDNFYDPGTVSADGHQWLLQANANDYLAQAQASNFARAYPGGARFDVLASQRDGLIWNAAQAAGKTVRNYGEYESLESGSQGTWQQYYADSQIMEGKATGPLPVAEDAANWFSQAPSLNQVTDHDYPRFDVGIPDQYRTDVWEQDFRHQLKTHSVPNLTIMMQGNDHVGGLPTPAAEVADSDLATGRVISDISHSPVWKDSAVFVEEDDTQNGVDHVDGHRGPLWIASPYATRGAVNSDYYTQVNVDKTIEQILGAQPMNQMDRAAVPMYDAFTNTPDLARYTALPNEVPLTQGVTNLIPLSPAANDSTATAARERATAGPAAPPVPAAQQAMATAWNHWYATQVTPKLTGPNATPDATDPGRLNRYEWYTATNWTKPYPGEPKILAPDQIPAQEIDQ
ncbi:MAG: phosphoesterase [Pseudonocardia sp.]|nr:phosphoesterase [Pseudonocardia sp.]